MSLQELDQAALAENLCAILGDLIALRSDYPPGDTRPICAYAADRMSKAGYDVATHMRTEPYANAIGRLGNGHPSIVFNAHADTVGPGAPGAWSTDPLKAQLVDGRLIGLGAANCKGSMAVHLWLADEIARRGGVREGEVVFTFVGDEETIGPDGTNYLREEKLVSPDILVVGAPTENDLIIAERGVMWVRVTAFGKAAHAGDVAAGDNAVERLMRLLAAIQKDVHQQLASRQDGLMLSTSNIGQLHGGLNTNVVPSEAVAEIDRRLLPSETVEEAFNEIVRAVEASGEPKDRYRVELLAGTNGFKGSPDGRGVKAFHDAIEATLDRKPVFLNAVGASDGRYFADDGIEIISLGPGAGEDGHSANESVAVAQLVDAAIIHLNAIDRLLGLNG